MKKAYPIKVLCEVMQVSRSGYYAWRKRDDSARRKENGRLVPLVRELHRQSDRTYGARRMADDIREQGIPCGRYRPAPGLMHHSDRGVQYCSSDFQNLLEAFKMKCSMSRKGDCWDNAVAESFFHSLQTEHVYFEDYKTRAEAIGKIFEYIEVFYNRTRRHSTLEYRSPVEFEAMTASQT